MAGRGEDQSGTRSMRGGTSLGVVAACLLAVLGACSTDREYDAALRANTIVAFDDYLRLHPDGAHAAEARVHLAGLVESREWQRAHATDTSEAYQQYLRSYPSGAHAHDALIAIADLNLAAIPNSEASSPRSSALRAAAAAPAAAATPATETATPAVKGAIARTPDAAPVGAAAPPKPAVKPTPPPSPAAVAKLAAKPPAPAPIPAKPAAPTPTHAATAPGIAIQLGAFGSEASAKGAWKHLAERYPELAGRTPSISAAHTADGRDVHRLQVGGFSHESAEAMCRALAAAGDACLLVPPKS
jgi:cell division septation protein DedD